MKKKLILILTVMILLTGKAQALTLTQKLGNEYIETEVEEGERVTMSFTSKVGFQFKNWEISGITELDITDPSISFDMPNNDVIIEGKYDSKYIVTFNGNTGLGSMVNQEIPAGGTKKLTKNTFTKDGYIFKGWSEMIDGDAKYADESSIKPESNMTLYAVWEEELIERIPLENLQIGTYIEYNPIGEVIVSGDDSGTGVDQRFNTESNPYTGGWRVIYKDNDKITLISAESVGTLTLGKKASGTDETDEDLNGSKIAYAKALYTLNEMCRDFATGEFAVRDESRCLGYNGTAIESLFDYIKTDGTKITLNDITFENIATMTGVSEELDITIEPWGDSYYYSDLAKLEVLGDISSTGTNDPEWWLASRTVRLIEDVSFASVRTLARDGDVSFYELYSYFYECIDSFASSYGVRPVIVLEPGIKVLKGEGQDGLTVNTAYTLSR